MDESCFGSTASNGLLAPDEIKTEDSSKFDFKEPISVHSKSTNANDCDYTENDFEEGWVRLRSAAEEMLREFDVLDEVGADDDEDDDLIKEESDSDLSDDEVDALLEEDFVKKQPFVKRLRGEDGEPLDATAEQEGYTQKSKVLMVEKVKDPFEVLPDGWVSLSHESGMPLYLHRPTRVCTLSKPYFLGPGSARKHAIPLSAVPCLEYRRAKQEETIKKENTDEKPNIVINGVEIPSARVETVQDNEQKRQLSPLQLRDYCSGLFEFKTIQIVRFKSWTARRKFRKQNREGIQRPTLPKDTKLITCPVVQPGCKRGQGGRPREWVMNPVGKSFVCILHEYVQRALKNQPVYTFKELEHTAMPYMATVTIGDIQYGQGMGTSKKQAKHNAAKATLEILIPEIKQKMGEEAWGKGKSGGGSDSTTADLSFFDDIKIEDPRVTEFCMKTTEPLPHTILLTCLQRNFGLTETNIKYETKPVKHSKNEFTMIVGSHTVKVICQNKRDGKQKASQAILQLLHPHVPSWGSLLRLYGNNSVKSVKEKKMEEQKITLLQSRGNSDSPNYAILDKLKEEMRKYKEMKSAVKPIGKFIPPDDVDLPQASNADLDNVVI